MKKYAYNSLKEFLEEQIYGHEKIAEKYIDTSSENADFHKGAAAEAEFILKRVNRMHELGWL